MKMNRLAVIPKWILFQVLLCICLQVEYQSQIRAFNQAPPGPGGGISSSGPDPTGNDGSGKTNQTLNTTKSEKNNVLTSNKTEEGGSPSIDSHGKTGPPPPENATTMDPQCSTTKKVTTRSTVRKGRNGLDENEEKLMIGLCIGGPVVLIITLILVSYLRRGNSKLS